MRKFFRSKSKKIATIAIAFGLALALIPAVNVFADWGPDRPTFTWANPATYITFNSITDNPQAGNERSFYGVRDVNNPQTSKTLTVQDNQELVFQVYFHNNAASNLNLVATNTRVKMLLPPNPTTSAISYAYISADNATPAVVGDTVQVTGARPFTLSYENGTAQIWNEVLRGTVLNDSIVTNNGALIGYDKLTGELPGCSHFSGYATIKVRVHMPTPPAPATTTPAAPAVTPGSGKPGGTLPNTGPGDIAGLFVGTSALGGVGHYLITRRRH